MMKKFDESELGAFFCRYFCPFSFYSISLFLRGREKEGTGEQLRQKMDVVQFHQNIDATTAPSNGAQCPSTS